MNVAPVLGDGAWLQTWLPDEDGTSVLRENLVRRGAVDFLNLQPRTAGTRHPTGARIARPARAFVTSPASTTISPPMITYGIPAAGIVASS